LSWVGGGGSGGNAVPLVGLDQWFWCSRVVMIRGSLVNVLVERFQSLGISDQDLVCGICVEKKICNAIMFHVFMMMSLTS
jgi:hypothetical protein